MSGLFFIVETSFNTCDMSKNVYTNKVLFIVGAHAAILFLLDMSDVITKTVNNKVVNHIIYLGRNSIDIVIWHVLSFRVIILLQIIILNGHFSDLTSFPTYTSNGLWWIGYVFVEIYVSLFVAIVLRCVHRKLVGFIGTE